MGVIQRVVKPRTRKAKKALEKREPKIIENTKMAMLIKGQNTSEISRNFLKDLYSLKKKHSIMYSRKNPIIPFEDTMLLEKYAKKHDASLFAFVNHSKKRPHNVIIGRMFDYQLLDMIELGIEGYLGISQIPGPKVAVENKPVLVFCGSQFESETLYIRLKSLLIDFFRGVEAKSLSLQGFEHVLFFLLKDGKLYLRSYKILLKKSGTKIPRVELMEIGPASTMSIRRHNLASDDLYKRACKKPKSLKPKKKKNISQNVLGTKLARIHMTKQNLDNLQTRKLKGLKEKKLKQKSTEDQATTNGIESEVDENKD